MNKRIENLVKRIKKNDGKSVTLRRDILVKMAEEQLFDYMDSYSYDEMFGECRENGVKGNFIEVCQDVQRSHGGSCYVSLIGNTLKFDCYVHSNNFFDLYIELKEDEKKSEEIEILEDVKVELNEDKNGVEIYFSNKPSEEVRNNLKSHGFRWLKYNKCWYAKQSEDTLNFANSLLPKEDDKINDLSEDLPTADLSNIDSVNEDEELEKAFNDSEYLALKEDIKINTRKYLNERELEIVDETPINNKLCKEYSKEELIKIAKENNIKIKTEASKEYIFISIYNWILEGDEMQESTEIKENIEVENMENIINKANNLIENIEVEKGRSSQAYLKYAKENNIKTNDKNSIYRKALQVHLMRYGLSQIWYKAAEKKNVKTKEELANVYFNELVNMLKNENIDIIEEDKITISSPQNDSLDMNLQLLANEKPSNNAIKIDCKEVLKETEDYILFKKGNIYVLRYFDECFYHEKYDRNKKIAQSRITKYYDNIKHLLE